MPRSVNSNETTPTTSRAPDNAREQTASHAEQAKVVAELQRHWPALMKRSFPKASMFDELRAKTDLHLEPLLVTESVLGLSRQVWDEDPHTEMIGGFLDPRVFPRTAPSLLRGFFGLLSRKEPSLGKLLTAAQCKNCSVYIRPAYAIRTKDHHHRVIPDLVLSAESAIGRVVVLVENKILSEASKAQLDDYKSLAHQRWPRGEKTVPVLVYLTVKGDFPGWALQEEVSGWIPLSHRELAFAWRRAVQLSSQFDPETALLTLYLAGVLGEMYGLTVFRAAEALHQCGYAFRHDCSEYMEAACEGGTK